MLKHVRGMAFIGFLVAGAGFLAAQTKPADTVPAATTAATKPLNDLKITLMDGSMLQGKISVPDLAIDTKFGTLKVPVDEIQSFAPGLQSHSQFDQQLQGYINDLAADAFADREKAQSALMRLGPAVRPELERQLKTAENEKAMRLQKILEDFDTQAEEETEKPTSWIKDDVIVTAGFTIVGRITTPGFAITSNYGTLQVKLADIREAKRDVGSEPEEIHKSISVPGQTFANRSYTTTTIKLNKGDQVQITATGIIVMQNNDLQSTPDGGSNFGNIGGVMGGTLVGRIGESGAMIKIGSKASFTADHAGVLELGIASQGNYSNYSFTGEYQTKIRVLKK